MRGVTIAASAALILILGLTKPATAQVCSADREKDMLAPFVDTPPAKHCGQNSDGDGIMNDVERQTIVDLLQNMRQSIVEGCQFGYEKVKPGLFSIMTYDCDLEQEVKFSCADASATSDNNIWRQKAYSQRKRNEMRTSLFMRVFPKKWQMYIKDGLPDVSKMDADVVSSMMLFLDSKNHLIGCYIQACEDDEYIACTTGNSLGINGRTQLYSQGVACSDQNCDPAFAQEELKTCDPNLHLCGIRTEMANINYELEPTPPRLPATTTTTMATMFTNFDNMTVENTTIDNDWIRNITAFDLTNGSNGRGILLELVLTGFVLIGFVAN